MGRRFTVCATLLVLCAASGAARAATYYVRTTGSDSNAGNSAKKAFRTITKALSVAKNNDVIWVGAGTYSEQINPTSNGTSAKKPLRLFGDPSGKKTGDAGAIIVTRSGSVVADISRNYFSIRDLTISGGTDGVRWSGTGGILQNVVVRDCSDDALELSSGTLTATNVTLNNAGDCGIALSGGATLTFNTGFISDCTGQGILSTSSTATATVNRTRINNQLGRGVDMTAGNVTLRNCVVYDNTSGNIRADGTSASVLRVQYCTLVGGAAAIEVRGITTTVQNVIMSDSGSGIHRLGASPATTLTHSNNLYWNLSTNISGWSVGPTDVTANPSFMDPSNKDFNIGGASAAYNRGVNISGVTVDYLNRSRPALGGYDIGAYEGQTPAATVPYFASFESAVGAEWSSSTTTSTIPSFSTFLGRFANEQQGVRIATTIGESYTLIFDGLFLDSWDGDSASNGPDTFMVYVGGMPALDDTFSHQPDSSGATFSYDGWPRFWSTNLGFGTWRDQLMPQMVVRFTATTSETVITFEGSGLQGVSDESWGVDNVRVVARADEASYLTRYSEVGHGSGWYAFMGGGSSPVVFSDLAGNGLPDAAIGGATTVCVYRNSGSGAWAPFTTASAMRQACVMDLDNNGSPEVWYNRTGSAFGAFRWSTSGLISMTTPSTIVGVSGCETMAAADMNKDGYCDLVLLGTSGNHIALNSGPNASEVFTGFTMNATMLPQGAADRGDGDNCSVGDVNNDGYPDIFYHYNGGRLFVSDGSGGYASNSLGISVSTGSTSKMGSAFGDYDNDGDLDLFVGRRSGSRAYLWRNSAGTSFSDVAGTNGLQTLANVVSASWGDYDNDGDLDLAYVTTSGTTGLARNSGSPSYTFTAVTEGFLTESRAGDIAFTDYDNDGDLDLALTSEVTTHPALLFRNDGPDASNSLSVRVVGAGKNGLNTAGIGARVELWNASDTTLLQRRDIGLAQGFGGQSSLRAHFGGINPASTYTVRVYGGAQPITATVTPALASTTFNNGTDPETTVPRLLTITESATAPEVRITRWHEVRDDE